MVTVAFEVAGSDITANVVFEGTTFTAFVNGKPGEGHMRVRDDDRTMSFTTGDDLLVTVNGDAAWRGFIQTVVETFIAPTGTSGPTRFWDIVAADYNLLFLRRVVEDQSTPTNVAGTQFPPGTADTTAITELLDNWLDLSSDDLDTTSGVTHVGDLDPAQKTRAWSGGWYWNNAMDTIAMLPAAIYYLRPETGSPKATLCYVDVDVPTSPFGLSDKPNGTTTKGYREMEITLDGSSMANDVMGWGFGYGSSTPVFRREQAASSIADHGRWQQGLQANGVYKQATINRMVDSIINGSPSSKRGAKNDRPYVKLVTYEPGLLAGHVVDFESQVWGFSDAIPVRQLTLIFEGPQVARYEIVLSHEIDAPWGFIDQFWPKMPGFGPCYVWPCQPPPCPTCGQQQDACPGCGITDTFSRTVASGWGTSDAGYPYIGVSDSRRLLSVNPFSGSVALAVETAPTTGNLVCSQRMDLVQQFPIDLTFDVAAFVPAVNAGFRWIYADALTGSTQQAIFDYDMKNKLLSMSGNTSFSPNYSVDLSTGDPLRLRVENDGSSLRMMFKHWVLGDPEPAAWDAVFTDVPLDFMSTWPFNVSLLQNRTAGTSYGSVLVTIDTLNIVGACNTFTDDFNRNVSGSLGTSPMGLDWNNGTISANAAISVNGSEADLNTIGPGSLGISQCGAYLGGGGGVGALADYIDQPRTLKFRLEHRSFTPSDVSWELRWDCIVLVGSLVPNILMQAGNTRLRFTAGPSDGTLVPDAFFTDSSTYTWTVYSDGAGNMVSQISDGTTSYSVSLNEIPTTVRLSVNAILVQQLPFTGSDKHWLIDEIRLPEFEPCFYDGNCVLTLFDDFNRTVGAGWGTASPSGFAWTAGGSHGSVSPGYGRATLTAFQQQFMKITAPGPWTTSTGFTLTYQFRSSSVSGSSGINAAFFEVFDQADFDAGIGMDTTIGAVSVSSDIASNSVPYTSWIANEWYWAKIEYVPGDAVRMKVWDTASTEPVSWTVEAAAGAAVSTDLTFGLENGSTSARNLDVTDINFCAGSHPGGPIDPAPSPASSPGAWGCEKPTRVSSTAFTTHAAFLPGSTLVWADGLFQRRGPDYTEDAGNQGITFGSAPSGEVRVCYFRGVLTP